MTLFSSAGMTHEPALAREVYDVSGAGDTVIATLAVMLGSGLPMQQAMRQANLAAGIVVGKLGTATCSLQELQAAVA
jgi:bifunctional ADP-heptose synthase (sugar kinase/adenylyltransferase)